MRAMQEGSDDVDFSRKHNTLNPYEAYKHSMVPGPWVVQYGLPKATEMAIKARQDFVEDMMLQADINMKKAAKATTYRESRKWLRWAHYYFGMAMHPIMDGHSPPHGPWKVYTLTTIPGLDLALLGMHHLEESGPPSRSKMVAMRNEIRKYYRRLVPKKWFNFAVKRQSSRIL